MLSGASLGQSLRMGLKGAVFGAIGAGVANVIGSAWGGSTTFGAKAGRAILHGLSRAAISKAQGGRWSAGFWSGFASSALSPLTGSASTFEGKVAMSAIVGGTAAELGGGKFANGAVSAAFVMMYNEMAHPQTIPTLTPAEQRAMYARMQEPELVDVSEVFVPVVRLFRAVGAYFGIGTTTEALSVEMVDITARRSGVTNYRINVSVTEARYNLEMSGYTSANGVRYGSESGFYNIYTRSSTGNPGMEFYSDGIKKVKYDLIGDL